MLGPDAGNEPPGIMPVQVNVALTSVPTLAGSMLVLAVLI